VQSLLSPPPTVKRAKSLPASVDESPAIAPTSSSSSADISEVLGGGGGGMVVASIGGEVEKPNHRGAFGDDSDAVVCCGWADFGMAEAWCRAVLRSVPVDGTVAVGLDCEWCAPWWQKVTPRFLFLCSEALGPMGCQSLRYSR
jgi:hypothetical protein